MHFTNSVTSSSRTPRADSRRNLSSFFETPLLLELPQKGKLAVSKQIDDPKKTLRSFLHFLSRFYRAMEEESELSSVFSEERQELAFLRGRVLELEDTVRELQDEVQD